jgi:hypothetical protein
VHPGREKSRPYFLSSGGTGKDLTKSVLGHVVLNLCSLHPVGSAGHVVHFGAFAVQKVNALFFMLGWYRFRFDKKQVGHVMSNLCFSASGGICGSHSAFWCIWGV